MTWGWETLLRNVELMTVSAAHAVATIDGVLLFGRTPNRYVPQSGIRAVCYPGIAPDYAARADEHLRGPMVPLHAANSSMVETGLVEQAVDLLHRPAVEGRRGGGPGEGGTERMILDRSGHRRSRRRRRR